MKKIKGQNYYFVAILILLVSSLSACTPNPGFELYEGNALHISVVGEPPEVKEEQVRFTKIAFDEMKNNKLDSYDAVIITENNLTKAAENQYAEIYLNSTIPFFFIGTDNYVPFTEKDLEYNESMNWARGNGYAVGILNFQESDELKKWEYGLYNDVKNDENVKDVYSRIFKTINELKQ